MSAATLDLRPTPLAAAEKRRDLSRRRAAGAAALGALSRNGPQRARRHLPPEPSEPAACHDIEKGGIRVDDVNGDGLDDIVQVRFDAVDVWLNVDGLGWTKDRHIIAKAPHRPSFLSRTRLVDVNGSGTRDIWDVEVAEQYVSEERAGCHFPAGNESPLIAPR